MKEITQKDYEKFIKKHKEIVIEDTKITIGEKKKIKKLQPEKFELQTTSVWSFPKRGNWATHKGDYRGNWAPEIPRNIILRYSKEGDLVLDQMVGGGTTLIECKLTGRNGIGVDINKDAIMLTRDRLNFDYSTLTNKTTNQRTFIGDARNLNLIKDNSVDLIATHPPYASIITYSKNSKKHVEGDLSYVQNIDEFAEEMKKVAKESFRVLKPGKYCAILIGDTRRNKHYVPITPRVLQAFLDVGFILKEDIIKKQWQCKTTGFWTNKSKENNFLLIMHEHLFVFRKPEEDEKMDKFKESMKWW
ncbi:MAG: methyltransferase domain-containing protein [Candidatus Aenigmarchaeota archaeon]|nr:methyltransferase domain-containing protein [Candidatus Aenigmarchaeota archaeon]